MNILIPDQWLREQLQSDAKPQDIQKYLSLCGPSVERIYHKTHGDGSSDEVYDIEVTTNRVDSMSIRGIAREAATILRRSGFQAKLKKLPERKITQDPSVKLALPEIIYETDSVKRVTCVVLTQVKQNASPQYMQNRLADIEMNSHGSIIDITNYITHEFGHPCHAFDYDKILAHGNTIVIREAKPGEEFSTLDGNSYQTLGGEVVLADKNGTIIDLPAIKGTANTAIDKHTSRVLFWIESLDAKKVRFASMSHAIRTVAAELNEKNVDPHLATEVLAYGVELFQKLCQAKVASKVYDYFPKRKASPVVKISLARIQEYLGLELTVREIRQILLDLDFQVEVKENEKAKQTLFSVQAPSFRQDISIPADIVEEIARIYGYHKLPSTLMTGALPLEKPTGNFDLEYKVKAWLADFAWQEIYSYSLVSDALAIESGYTLGEHLQLANPLKEENTYLRRSLLPSLREILEKNPQAKRLTVFELASVYDPIPGDLPQQNLQLALLSRLDYREVKGKIWQLFQKLFLFAEPLQLEFVEEHLSSKKQPLLSQKAELRVTQGKKSQKLAHVVIYRTGLVGFEFDWNVLLSLSHRYPHYQKLLHTASIVEDFTFTLSKSNPVGPFMETLQAVDPRIRSFQLTSIYEQNYSFSVIFQDPKENLSSEDVESIRQKMVQTASQKFAAKLVGASLA